jgi:hypothetical protein
MRIVGFTFPPETEAQLERLQQQLGWTRSRIIRELVACAVVQGQPSISVVLPASASAAVEEVPVG